MKIVVKLISFLCKFVGREENRYVFSKEIAESSSCSELLKMLQIPSDIHILILVNGSVKDEKYVLKEGDEIVILPPLEGG